MISENREDSIPRIQRSQSGRKFMDRLRRGIHKIPQKHDQIRVQATGKFDRALDKRQLSERVKMKVTQRHNFKPVKPLWQAPNRHLQRLNNQTQRFHPKPVHPAAEAGQS